MRGLTQIVVEKLNSDLPAIQYDDFTFSHTIDEALSFNKELTENYSYPPSQPNILAVLTQAQVFQKWLTMERKCEKQNQLRQKLQSIIFQTRWRKWM